MTHLTYVKLADELIGDAMAAAVARRDAGLCPCCGVLAESQTWDGNPPLEVSPGVSVCGWCAAAERDAVAFAQRTVAAASRWAGRHGGRSRDGGACVAAELNRLLAGCVEMERVRVPRGEVHAWSAAVLVLPPLIAPAGVVLAFPTGTVQDEP